MILFGRGRPVSKGLRDVPVEVFGRNRSEVCDERTA